MFSILINHCWCSDSIWGGVYDCRVVASIRRIPEGKTYYDEPTEDWTNLVEIDKDYRTTDEHSFPVDSTLRLKPEVHQWMEQNIPDRNKVKGWTIGTDKYNSIDTLSFSFFFQSAHDAEKFIKKWSSIGKPAEKLNYFKDKRYKYNPKTKTLQRIER